MPRAVRFDRYGMPASLLWPAPVTPTSVLVTYSCVWRAAGTSPGEAKTASGALHELWPAAFPSGQGSGRDTHRCPA
jgi:NADPH2:quinone reductase